MIDFDDINNVIEDYDLTSSASYSDKSYKENRLYDINMKAYNLVRSMTNLSNHIESTLKKTYDQESRLKEEYFMAVQADIAYTNPHLTSKDQLNKTWDSINDSFQKDKSVLKKAIDYADLSSSKDRILFLSDFIVQQIKSAYPYINGLRILKSFRIGSENTVAICGLIKERIESVKPRKAPRSRTPTALHYALKVYYLQQSKYMEYFENHPSGVLAGIKEFVNGRDYHLKSDKNFQQTYNKISNYSTNRISKQNAPKIKFVIEHMLIGYPKAIEIAEEELQKAISKNKYD
ncbi:hypothetical protein [Aureitalea marina]|uniref:Uncharacterized protein n=1 Tax=Aureitalea marina TaxID=930804 RepID=A0A2S7KNB1_9FLAO|nr:hypothetical protein [Aureitalea marina]PQB04115.1 hypothetical protein BST85_03765 [Aureitalea marina]